MNNNRFCCDCLPPGCGSCAKKLYMTWHGSIEFNATCCPFPNPYYPEYCSNPTIGPCETEPYNPDPNYNPCLPWEPPYDNAYGCGYFSIDRILGPLTFELVQQSANDADVVDCRWEAVLEFTYDYERCCWAENQCVQPASQVVGSSTVTVTAQVIWSAVNGWTATLAITFSGFIGGSTADLVFGPTPAQTNPDLCPDFSETFDDVITDDPAAFAEIPDGPMAPDSDPCNAGNISTFVVNQIPFPPIVAYDSGYVTFA